jgi:polyisoprenyl-phosphate glycosyltransferase
MYDSVTMNPSERPLISVVVPVYGSDKVLGELYERTAKTLTTITSNFEFIFVNDASPDNAWEVIKKLKLQDNRIRGINLSRNFGQYPALTAGLKVSRGEWVVVMDCDLQDLPEAIEIMYQKALEGFYVVVGSRQERHDSFWRSFMSFCFYATLTYLSGTYQNRSVANFGIYHRKVIDAILSLPEHMRYFSVMVRWVGFRTATVPVRHAERKGGKSGYSLRKLFTLAANIILAYSEGPLWLIIKIGIIATVWSGGYLCILVLRGFTASPASQGEFIFGSIWFIFGALATMLGVVALYLAKTFDEVKKRPIYIVQEEI